MKNFIEAVVMILVFASTSISYGQNQGNEADIPSVQVPGTQTHVDDANPKTTPVPPAK